MVAVEEHVCLIGSQAVKVFSEIGKGCQTIITYFYYQLQIKL